MPTKNENPGIAHIIATLNEPGINLQPELFNEGINSLKTLLQNSPEIFADATKNLNPNELLKLVEIIGVDFLRDNGKGYFVLYVLQQLPKSSILAVLNQLGGAKYIREKVTSVLAVAGLFEKLTNDLGRKARKAGEQETKKLFDEIGIDYFISLKNKDTIKIIESLPENMRLSTIESMGGREFIEKNVKIAKSFNKIINYYFDKDPNLPILETFSSEYLNKLFKKPSSLSDLTGDFSTKLLEKVISKLDDSLLNNSDSKEFFRYINYYEPVKALKVITQLPPAQLAKITADPGAIDLFLKIKSKDQSFQEMLEPLGGLEFLRNLFQTPKHFLSKFRELSDEDRADLFNYIGTTNIENFFGSGNLSILDLSSYLPKEMITQLSSMITGNQIQTPLDLKNILAMRSKEDVAVMLKGLDDKALKTIVENSDHFDIVWVTSTLKEILNITWQEFFNIYPLQDFFHEKVSNQNIFSEILKSMLPTEITEVIKSLDKEYLTKYTNKELAMDYFDAEAMETLIDKIDLNKFLFSGSNSVSGSKLINILEKMSAASRIKVIHQFDIEILEKHVNPTYFTGLMSILPEESRWAAISNISGIDKYLLKVLESGSPDLSSLLDEVGHRAFYSILGSKFVLDRSQTKSITQLAEDFSPDEIAKMILETDYLLYRHEEILKNINIFGDDDKTKILLKMDRKYLQEYKNYNIDKGRDHEFMNNVPAIIKNDISFRSQGFKVLNQMSEQQQIDFLTSLRTDTLTQFVKNSDNLNDLITAIPREYVETLITRLGGDYFVRALIGDTPSAILEKNLAELYHPIEAEKEYSHDAFIKFHNAMFPDKAMIGVCQGITLMATQAFLAGPEELQKFNQRLEFLVQHPNYYSDGTHAKLINQIIGNRDKARNVMMADLEAEGKSIPKNLNITIPLSMEQQRAIDVSAFMEGIALYLNPSNHHDTLGQRLMQVDIIEISKTLQSQALEDKGGLVEIDIFTGIYQADSSIIDYMKLLNKNALSTNCNLVFNLSSNNHATAIYFENSTKSWYFIDANNDNLVLKVNSIEELAELVFEGFDAGQTHTGFNTKVISTADDENAALNFVNGLKQSAEFHLLHDVTDKNKDLTSKRDVSLAYLAAKVDDDKMIAELINLKAKTLNQPVLFLSEKDIYVTPLMIASQNKSIESIKLLINAKDDGGEFLIDLNQADIKITKPIPSIIAAGYDSSDILKILLDARDIKGNPRLDIDGISYYEDNKSTSMVHTAAIEGSLNSLKILEKYGANMTLEVDGKKPIDLAIEKHQQPIIEFYTALDRRNELTQAVENLFQTGKINNFQAEQMKAQLISDFKQDHQVFLHDGNRSSTSFNLQDLEMLASSLPTLPSTTYSDEIASKTESSISSDSDLDEIQLLDISEPDSEDELSVKMSSTAKLHAQLGLNADIIKNNSQADIQILSNSETTEKKPTAVTQQIEANSKSVDEQSNENISSIKRVR